MKKERHAKPGFILALDTRPSLPIAAESVTEDGQPVRRFRKELIRTGSYVKASEGLEFEVTATQLDKWALTFSQMKANGVKVPVPAGHTFDVEKNRGWVVDMFRDGATLIGVIDLIGEAIALAGTSDVSIYSPPELVDGHGNRYEWPITHVALCTDPVIPGLGGFVPIAASQGATPVNVPVLTLSDESTKTEVHAMDVTKIQPCIDACNAMGEALKACIGAMTALTKKPLDEATQQAAIEAAKACKAACDETSKNCAAIAGDGSTTDSPADDSKPAEGGSTPAGEGGATSLSASRSPMLLSLAQKSRSQDLDGLVRAGKITPAVAAGFKAQYCEGQGLELSLTDAGCKAFDALIATLAKNEPVVSFGEKTRGQVLSLSNPARDENPAAKQLRDDMLADTKRMAGIK